MTILVLKAMVTMVTWGIPHFQTPPNGDHVFFWPQIYLMVNLQSSITGITGSFFHGIFVLRHPVEDHLGTHPIFKAPDLNSPHPQGDISHDWKSSHVYFLYTGAMSETHCQCGLKSPCYIYSVTV